MAQDQVNLGTLIAGVVTDTGFETEKVGDLHRPVHHTRDGGDETQGAKGDGAATTDTGTFTLMGFIKRLLSVGLWVRGNTYTDYSISSATGSSQAISTESPAAVSLIASGGAQRCTASARALRTRPNSRCSR